MKKKQVSTSEYWDFFLEQFNLEYDSAWVMQNTTHSIKEFRSTLTTKLR